jgi:DNA polymerase III alpha subunit
VKTALSDRELWYDGKQGLVASMVPDALLAGTDPSDIILLSESADTQRFNDLSDVPLLTERLTQPELDREWRLPPEFLQLNLREHVLQRVMDFPPAYHERAKAELQEIERRGLDRLFKALVYVVDTFNATSTVWGVGRGSSCASLVLFLLGLHSVDPVKHSIPLEEFFHD